MDKLRDRFPHIAIALTLLVAVGAALDWAANVGEKIELVAHWLESEKPVLPNTEPVLPYTEIVIDRSEQMNRPILEDPNPKWVVAKQALLHVDISKREYLALRTFGGPCRKDLGPPDLPFSLNAKEKIISTLDKIKPDGKGNLANAVIAAIDDLPEIKGISLRVVVITGSNDDCTQEDQDQIAKIKEHQLRTRKSDVQLDFRFIAVALGDAEKQKVQSISDETKGKVIFVNKREEIAPALNTFVVWEPIAKSADSIVTILNNCNVQLNKVFDPLNRPGAPDVEDIFQAARDECIHSNRPFADLIGKQESDLGSDAKELYERASECRNMRDRILEVMEGLIASAKSGDVEGYNSSLKVFTDVRDTYNKGIVELNAALERLKYQRAF